MRRIILLLVLWIGLFLSSEALANTVCYHIYDSPGRSVTSLVNTSSGIKVSYNHDSFGNIINNNIQYTGQQKDWEVYSGMKFYPPFQGSLLILPAGFF